MANKSGEPNFVQAWIKDLSDEVNDAWYRIVPFWFLLFFSVASAAAYFMPQAFWINSKGELSQNVTVVYASALTLNGIIIALSWSAFAKIYEMIGAGRFSGFLQENGVLEPYLFLIRYVHVAQMVALVASVVALLVTQYPQVPMIWQRVCFVALLGFGAYAVKQAATVAGVMQDLVRYRATFDNAQGKNNIRPVA